jgi:ADP-ribose pyrophosphatase YjhB (NUDIX family)
MRRTPLDGRDRWQCSTCGYIHYENPVPGVGVLIEHDGRLLLIQRGMPPHAGEWTFPSGFIEIDETAEDAAVREAFEETGLRIALTGLLSAHSFPEGPPVSGIILFYTAQPIDASQLAAGDDALDARFVPLHDIPELPFRTHAEALAIYKLKVGRG